MTKTRAYIYLFITFCALGQLRAQSILDKQGKEVVVQMDEVVVTGTGTEHRLKDAPVQTEVINSKALRNYAGKNVEDILSGLTASFEFSEGDMGSQMQMNGLGNNYILILINGKRIHGDVGGENDLGLIDPHNIEKIEIVKGASSALYGSDAIAGVINIITRKHDNGTLVENSTRVGMYADVRQHNGIGLTWGKLSSYTNFQLQHTDGWQNTSIEDPKQTEFLITDSRNKTVNEYTNWQIAERLIYNWSKTFETYAEGSYYGKRIYRPSGKYPQADVHTYDMQYRNASASVGGKLKLNGTDYLTADIDWNKHAYYYAYTDTTLEDGYYKGEFTNYFPYFPGQRNLQSDQQRTLAQVKSVFYLAHSQMLSAGAEWRYDWLRAPTRIEGGNANDNTAALYVQDEWNELNWLSLTAGIRLNQNKAFGFRATPKASAMVSLGDWRIRASWSQGFKTPTLKELYYQYVRQMTGTYLYMGNTELKPQTSNYYQVGVEYRNNVFNASATAYLNKLGNMITLVTIPRAEVPAELLLKYDPIATRQYKNMEDAKTYGVDVNVGIHPGAGFNIALNYSYLDTKAHVYNASHHRLDEVVIDGMAHHKGNVNVTWNRDMNKHYKLGVGVYGRASSMRYYQLNGNGKAYQLWKVATNHEFSKSKKFTYRVEAGVDNVFNFVDRTYHGLHLGTTSPGTTVYVGVNIRFKEGKQTKSINIKTIKQTKDDEQD